MFLPAGKIGSFVLFKVNQIHKVIISIKGHVVERKLCFSFLYSTPKAFKDQTRSEVSNMC